MGKLGISIYPEHSTKEKDFAYMELASKYGIRTVFTCLLSAQKSKEEIHVQFREYTQKAHELGFQVMVDVAPLVITHLGDKAYDLSNLKAMGFDCIRLDKNFGPLFDNLITQNSEQLQIAFNGSSDAGVKLLLKHGANQQQMSICHNFYPQPFTGLDTALFRKLNDQWRELGLEISAFISSQEPNRFGPWPLNYGLCTREEDRFLPIATQVRHMICEKHISTCIIGNAYASEAELRACADVLNTPALTLVDVETLDGLEKNIIFEMSHQGRFDCGDYMIHSIFPRLRLQGKDIEIRDCKKKQFERGDVIIVNKHMKHYQGEGQIVLKSMQNIGNHNLVGRISSEDIEQLVLFEKERSFTFRKL